MGKPSINGPFSIAMLNNQRVSWDGCYNSDLFDREPDIIRLQQVAEAIDIYLLFGVAEVSHAECIEPPLVVGRGFKHGRIDGWITYFETGERWGKMGKVWFLAINRFFCYLLTGAFYVGLLDGLLGWLLVMKWIIPENSLRLAPGKLPIIHHQP